MYFRAAAKSREGLVDDPGTKAEKEEAASSIYDFVQLKISRSVILLKAESAEQQSSTLLA